MGEKGAMGVTERRRDTRRTTTSLKVWAERSEPQRDGDRESEYSARGRGHNVYFSQNLNLLVVAC